MDKVLKAATQKFLLLVTFLLASCSPVEKTPNNLALDDELTNRYPVEVLNFPPSVYYSLTWLADENIMVSNAENRHFLFSSTTLSIRELNLPQDPSCSLQTRYLFPTKLPTNDIGFVKECRRIGERQSVRLMIAINPTTLEVDNLVEAPLPNIGGSSFSWNPRLSMGFQEAGSLFRTIYRLTPEKTEPLEVEINGWSLAQNYNDMLSRHSNDNVGLARAPHLSPDGQSLAFWASTEAIGRSGQQRLLAKYGLYLMDINTLQPNLILDDIYFPRDLFWDPTGQFIAISGDRTNHGNPGLWILDLRLLELSQVSSSEISLLSWSPDGKSLVALRECPEEGCLKQDEITQNLWDQFGLETCTSKDLFCEEIIKIGVASLVDPSP